MFFVVLHLALLVVVLVLVGLSCAKKKRDQMVTRRGEVNVTLNEDSNRTVETRLTASNPTPGASPSPSPVPAPKNNNLKPGQGKGPPNQAHAKPPPGKLPPPPPPHNNLTNDSSKVTSRTVEDERRFIPQPVYKPKDKELFQKQAKWTFLTHLFRKEQSKKKKNDEERKKQEALQKLAADMKTVEPEEIPVTKVPMKDSDLQPTQGSDKEMKRSKKNLRTCVTPTLDISVNVTQEQTQNTTRVSDKERISRSGKSNK